MVWADALPPWFFIWRILCRRSPSGGCFAAVVVLLVGWFSLGFFGGIVSLSQVQLFGWR